MGLSRPLLLCSASPRRATLLASAGIPFELGPPPDVDETPPVGLEADRVAAALCVAKARRARAGAPDRVVLCADTTVILDRGILEKPRDDADAIAMLESLSGRTHRVVTAIAIASPWSSVTDSDEAVVTFRPIERAEIEAYVKTGEPFGKAGGYAIQGGAGAFVSRLDGDVETVVGLPTRLVRRMLLEVERLAPDAGDR